MLSKSLIFFCLTLLFTLSLINPIEAIEVEKKRKMVNIVLVHGALADGTSWSGVIPILQAHGYNVTAVQEPLSSIPDDIAKVHETLAMTPGPVVLVGHSFGGIVVTNAGNADNVAALVYVAAFTPDEGQTVGDLGKDFAPLPSAKAFIFDAQGRFWLSQEDFLKYFCPDVPKEQARLMAAVQGPADGARFGWPSGTPAWKSKPSYFVVAEHDQIISPDLEKFEAKNIKAVKTVSVPNASHAVLVSHADIVANLIIEAAKAVAKS